MFSKIISNLALYTFSFIFLNFVREYRLIPDRTFMASYTVYISAWFVAGSLSRKFRREKEGKTYNIIYAYFIAFFLMLGAITILIIKFHLDNVSHFIFYSSLFLSFALEIIYLTTKYHEAIYYNHLRLLFNSKALFLEFFIYAVLMYYVLVLKLDYAILDEKHALLLLSLYLDWFIAVLFGHQFNAEPGKENYWNHIWSYLKSYIIVISLNISAAFILRVSHFDLLVVIQATSVYAFTSFVILTSMSVLKRETVKEENEPELRRTNLYKIINAMPAGISFDEAFQYEYPQHEVFSISLNNQLKEVYLKKFPNVYRFLNESINLRSFEVESSVVQRSNDISSIEILPDDILEFFFNLRQMNDLRRINCYLIGINKKLRHGGIFISKIETINQRYRRYLNSYPFYLAKLFYLFDFIWERVFPKLPWFQKIYFAFTRGNNRAVSFAEGLGRLYYCGFEIINAKEIDNFVYFIAKKVMPPCLDTNPSYGPLFKMKRTGYKGKPIFVYKLRTMHPYAEYLQKFVYDKFSLQEGGKFNNDFRVTSWGKIFRKLWIDELPMLINFFKGELKLVGVRPLSNHYLNLYSNELRIRRINYKPGLVPPFYVDMPKTLNEIMSSEERYLDLYDNHPVLTDIKYFFKAAYNIVIRKKRSK